jgi:hypothetical protein
MQHMDVQPQSLREAYKAASIQLLVAAAAQTHASLHNARYGGPNSMWLCLDGCLV